MKIKIVLIVFILSFLHGQAQDIPTPPQKFIYFPLPMDRKWTTSIGFTATTMPYEITEEIHYRIPAVDFHVLKKVTNGIAIDGRINFQAIQNLITLGPRITTKLTDRLSAGLGDDVGYWFGFINLEGFKTRGSGWQNYPNVSLGYRFKKHILLTVRAEAILTPDIKTYAGQIPVTTNYKFFSGTSYTVALEQPFYGKKSLTLGFRAMYTSFFWQTWTAFSSFDRNFFYPQIIVGLIL